jgi:hypothetical protein
VPRDVHSTAPRRQSFAATGVHHASQAESERQAGAKAKREALAEAFGNIAVDSEKYMNFLHSRRHLATGP